MPDRALLHRTKLKEFCVWLTGAGIQWRPGRGEYQALQVKFGGGWMPIFDRDSGDHLSVPDCLEPLVRRFIRETRATSTSTVSYGGTCEEAQ